MIQRLSRFKCIPRLKNSVPYERQMHLDHHANGSIVFNDQYLCHTGFLSIPDFSIVSIAQLPRQGCNSVVNEKAADNTNGIALSQKIWNLLVLIDQEVFHRRPEEPRERQQVVHRGQAFSVLPLADRLRIFKPEIGLNILYRQTGSLSAFSICRPVSVRSITGNTVHFVIKTPSFIVWKKRGRSLWYFTQWSLVISHDRFFVNHQFSPAGNFR